MKKRFVCLLFVFVCLLSACSSTKFPMSEQHEKYGRKALEIVDAYLDFDITIEEAESKLDALRKAESTLPESTEKEKNGNNFVTADVSNLYFNFNLAKFKGDFTINVLDQRNNLAELLGESPR